MSWSIGYDQKWKRDIGYGVPAHCDHPGCNAEIDRGLAFVCGGAPYGGEDGCGLYFCSDHLWLSVLKPQLCERCSDKSPETFTPKSEHPGWIGHKLNDASWSQWRNENPDEVEAMRKNLLQV